MNPEARIGEIDSLLEKHTAYRDDCLNLIASENRPSPLVERLIARELDHRYGSYNGIDLEDRDYKGGRYIVEIERLAQDLARELFGAEYVDLRPLSGNITGIAAAFALGSPGSVVLEVENAHRYAHKLACSELRVDLKAITIPWDGVRHNIDMDRTVSLIRKHRPPLVIIGSGLFLFPQPVAELKEAMVAANPESYLVYDAAHVMGLIAGGRFQSPLEEGADVIVTSTHKTLAGPQGGMILTNDRSAAELIGQALVPLLVANHHLSRIPALAGTFVEWLAFGEAHAGAIVSNAKALGRALKERGVPLVGEDLDFTESHTLLPIVDAYGESKALAERLEACGIIVDPAEVSPEVGKHGLRIGVQEVTRMGMTEADAPAISDCIVDGLKGDDLGGIRTRATGLAKQFDRIQFTFDSRQ